jgi:transcriptional regulator with XRE-family HTH domain
MSTLRQHRLSKGMTLQQIAGTLGVSLNSVHSWETGRCLPRPRMFPKIARVLGMEPMELTKMITGEPAAASAT